MKIIHESLKKFLAPPDIYAKKRVLYLTGLAGSGKTTVAHILEERLQATLINEFVDPIPLSVMETRTRSSFEEKIRAQEWILGQCIKKNQRIEAGEGTIIVDRTWVDALVYSKIYGDDVLEQMSSEARNVAWYPGVYIILFADEAVLKQRLQQKFGITEQYWNESWGPYIQDLHRSVTELAKEVDILAIDTSCRSAENVSALIEERFTRHYQN